MDVNKLLLVAAVFILTLIKQSPSPCSGPGDRHCEYNSGGCGAIQCYDCWTKQDDTCGYPETLGEPGDCEARDNVCKKVVTRAYSVIKKGRDSYYELVSNVTSRLCGKSHWTGCKTMTGAASETIECACDEDGCNSAPMVLSTTTSAMILSVTTATSALLLHHKLSIS